MANYKTFERKLRGAITALTSSILTSLICDVFSNTSYVLQTGEKQYMLTPTGNSFSGSVVFVILIFSIIWIIISIIIPIGSRLKERVSYRKIDQPNGKTLVGTFNQSKEIALSLRPVFINEIGNVSDLDTIKLYTKDLANVITALHKKFKPHNKKMQKHIVDHFRKPAHSSIFNIDSGISDYEFSALIVMLKKMVVNAQKCEKNTNEKLFLKDCNEMLDYLEELEKIS